MGANPTVRTSSGDTALHLAAKYNKWNMIERFVAQGCDVNETDSEGFFIIHRLAQITDLGNESFTSVEGAMDEFPLFLFKKLLEPRTHEAGLSDIWLDTSFSTLLSEGADLSVFTPAGDTALHLAARDDNWNLVERLVEQGCDTSTPDSEGFYILHRFAQRAQNDMPLSFTSSNALFFKLVEKGANPLACSRTGDSVLHLAAKHGDQTWTLVNCLLELGADINQLDSEGFSILHRLATKTFTSNVLSQLEVLVTKGADVNCKSPRIGTALHVALKNQEWDLAKRLVELGADVRECDCDGRNVLHIIANQVLSYNQRKSISLIQFLIEKGANVNARCPKGDSFFHLAAKHGNWEIVQQMISHPACNNEDINEKDSEGFAILHRAASSTMGCRSSLVHVLVSKGAKFDTPCPSGECALHLAVKHNNWSLIEELLQCKEKESQLNRSPQQTQWLSHLKEETRIASSFAFSSSTCFNIDTKDASGNTILHLCAKQMKWDLVYQLLMSGADPGLTDDEGHTILYRLASEDLDKRIGDSGSIVLECLRSRILPTAEMDEFGDTLIQIAARNRNLDLVRILLDLVDNVDVTDIDGLTLLHRVVQCTSPGSLRIVKALLKKNTDVEVTCPKGQTALHLAAQSGNWDIVRELLAKGAKAGETDSDGMSVLHRLVRRSSISMKTEIARQLKTAGRDPQLVKLLAGQSVDVNAKDPSSQTPLQLAVIDREWEMVQALLECGADVDRNVASSILFFHQLAKDTRVSVQVAGSVTKQLLTRGLDLNVRDSAGDTPLNLGAKHKNWRLVRVFLEAGADANIPDSEGWFVCHRLAMESGPFGNYRGYFCSFRAYHDGYDDTNVSDLLSLLTSNGFEVNQKGPDGKSSLQTALKHKKWEMVRWLVQFGASYALSLDEKKTIPENIFQLVGTDTDQDKIKGFIMHITDKDS